MKQGDKIENLVAFQLESAIFMLPLFLDVAIIITISPSAIC
jgi:hypothetical protein